MQEQLVNARRKVVGTRQTIKALEKGEARMVFLARDAEDKVIQPVASLCAGCAVELQYVDTMVELGKMCGIKVKAATAAIIEQ
ncbi:MAG TPA: ribosomal L7Ae/L30e/S12e/Gadd45 family protein [Candidatus Limnocylindrales bacterium]|nr:ribosomal L7Ae/L30e/S12e/Gadd45 family protein [Candidatus Limnocylindrales bacterium]